MANPSWNPASRASLWQRLAAEPWDLVVIGGGISGAGVAREAARTGARVLLLEARDFAWGTSSRSSKMVHGGLRYLASGQLRITAESVRERERMMAEAPGLVQPLRYVFPQYRGRLMAWGLALVLAAYDLLAGKWRHGRLSRAAVRALFPGLRQERLLGAGYFEDTLTDDARLCLRVLRAACRDGAAALNYAEVTALSRDAQGWRLALADTETGAATELRTRVVINATGVWADRLRAGPPRLRPLRGSHLLFPAERLPLVSTLVLQHPDDGRTLFLYPWAGASVVGTTDLDHAEPLHLEPHITGPEVDYLLAAANWAFPEARLSRADVVSTWAGVRPVIQAGQGAPSRMSREHAVWDEDGFITLAGGKLTTFRRMARDALRVAARYLPRLAPVPGEPAVLCTPESAEPRLAGWYGEELAELLSTDGSGERVGSTDVRWAELVYACRHEGVRHLDDLLLRRTRLGLILPGGAAALLPELKRRCQPELGWDEAHWLAEVQRYQTVWRAAYALPTSVAPDDAR